MKKLESDNILDWLCKYPLYAASKESNLHLGDKIKRITVNLLAITFGVGAVVGAGAYVNHLQDELKISRQGQQIQYVVKDNSRQDRKINELDSRVDTIESKVDNAMAGYDARRDTIIIENREVQEHFYAPLENQEYKRIRIEPEMADAEARAFSDLEIKAFVQSWLMDWQNSACDENSFRQYVSRYSADALVSTDIRGILDREQLIEYKKQLNERDDLRNIKASGDIAIERDHGNNVLVSFWMYYQSGSYQDDCWKRLLLRPEGNSLRIVKEECR